MATTEEDQQITEQGDPSPPEQNVPASEDAAPEPSSGPPSDWIAWFNSTIQQYDATFIVYYRGLW